MELSGGLIALICGGVLVVGLIALMATRSGDSKDPALSEHEQAEFDALVDRTIIDLTFSQNPQPGDPATLLEHVFVKLVPNYVIRLNAVSSSMSVDQAKRAVDAERRAILSDRLKHELDGPTMRTLGGVLERALSVRINGGAATYVEALESAIIAFNNRMVSAGHRFVLYSYVNSRGTVWLLSYRVDQLVSYRADQHTVRAIRVSRLDNLNFHANAFGFASEQRELAWVRARRIEEQLVWDVLPQLGDDKQPYYQLADRYALDKSVAATANRRASELFRADYGSSMADPAAAQRLGHLLARRREVFSRWYDLREGFKRTAKRLSRRLHLRRRHKRVLEGFPREDLLELMSIETELASPAMRRAFAAAMEIAMRTVEHHEVQHRLDFLRGNIAYPDELKQLVGPLETEDGEVRSFAQNTNRELSALLAELARAGDRSRSELAFQLLFLLDPSTAGSQYSNAVTVIVDALATQLQVGGGSVRSAGALRRERVVSVFVALTAKSGKQIADAARVVWQRLYGAPLAVLQRSAQ